MPKKRVKPEQVVTLLRQIEVAVANGKTTPQAGAEGNSTPVGETALSMGDYLRRCRLQVTPANPANP